MEKGTLLLYKQSPALLALNLGDKIEIKTLNGKEKKVRPKDVELLHPGPLHSLNDLEVLEANPEEAWELFQDEKPEFQDLVELIYGEYTVSSAWSMFLLLNRSPYFKGTIGDIETTTPEEKEGRIKSANEKKAAEEAWAGFLERYKSGGISADTLCESDQRFIEELERYSVGQLSNSRVLKAFGRVQTQENGHRLLMELKIKNELWNPYPTRSDINMKIPENSVPELPDEERVDLTHFVSYAIDDEGNRDPDDAIGIDGDNFWIHIADAASIVTPDSELDKVAASRVSTLYLPELTVPMLPRAVVELLGLGLNETSPAISFGFKYDSDGNLSDFRIVKSMVCVKRTTYNEVANIINEEPFNTISKITDRFFDVRKQNGAINLSLPEVQTKVVDNKVEIKPLPDLVSRKMVTESMVMVGFHTSKLLHEKGIAIPFVSQSGPDESVDLEDNWASMYSGRRLMQRSRVSLAAAPHAGLGLDLYTRATSPLRRYSDLIVMMQIRLYLDSKEPLSEDEVLQKSAICDSLSGKLTGTERKSNMHWKLVYLMQNPNWIGEAFLVEILENRGIFLIPELALECRLPMKEELKLNSSVKVAVKNIDLPEREVQFKRIK